MPRLVPLERCGRVVGTGREFFGERVRTNHGEGGAVTEERHARRSIADHRDPALRPAGQADLADRVEVEVVGSSYALQ